MRETSEEWANICLFGRYRRFYFLGCCRSIESLIKKTCYEYIYIIRMYEMIRVFKTTGIGQELLLESASV